MPHRGAVASRWYLAITQIGSAMSAFVANAAGPSCPLWVKSRHQSRFGQCPLYPQKRTLVERVGMSALCQKQTLATLRLSEKTPSPLAKRFRRTRVKIDTIVERYRINTN
jgi:hypothetical protein